jgi:hypothetical protein
MKEPFFPPERKPRERKLCLLKNIRYAVFSGGNNMRCEKCGKENITRVSQAYKTMWEFGKPLRYCSKDCWEAKERSIKLTNAVHTLLADEEFCTKVSNILIEEAGHDYQINIVRKALRNAAGMKEEK